MNLYPLQQYFKEDDPLAGIILGIGFGAALIVLVILNLVRRGVRRDGSGSKRFSSFALRRAVRSFGLKRDQFKLLEHVFRLNGVTDPFHALSLPAVLDKYFKKAYQQIERNASSEEEAQNRLALLFSVRNIIDISQNTSAQAPSAKQLTANQSAVLTVNQESYQVKIILTKEGTVFVDCPKNSLGTQIRFPKGSRGALTFFTKTNKGFSFDCNILGMTDTTFGPALQLSHSGRAKAMTQRRFRRRQSELSCAYYLVRVENTHGKKGIKMVVDSNRRAGTLVDISVGGCAIRSGSSVPVGSRLKIEFEDTRGTRPVAVLGQVLRMNRGGVTSTIIHVKFLKVPRKAMNAINTVVFAYSDE